MLSLGTSFLGCVGLSCTDLVQKSSLDYSQTIDKYVYCVTSRLSALMLGRYGEVGAMGLVMVHGNMANRKMFCHFATQMNVRHQGYRIYCIDVRFLEPLVLLVTLRAFVEGGN